MARTLGTYSLSANIEMLAGAPLDAREIVPAKADLTTSGMFPYAYIGMETYVVAENKKYRLIGIDPTVPTNWEEIKGGSEITPNPSSQATDNLSSIKIDNTVYSIVDATVPSWAKASSKPSYIFSEIGSTPTTLSGYGITDAKIANGTITLGSDTITPVTNVASGDGLTGGPITSSGTLKANLRSYTKLTNDSAAATETSGRVYPVALDKTGYLSVNVPWTDTTYSVVSTSANGLAPKITDTSKFLKGNGTWAMPSASEVGAIASTTYEYNKEIAFGSSGKLLIGKFPCYDSNVTITISSTTSVTYYCTAILATQNINTSGGGVFKWETYGDSSNAVTPNLYAKYASGSNVIEIYFSPTGWSKNLIHIQAVSLPSAPTNICENVSSIPTEANRQPTNTMVRMTATPTSGQVVITDGTTGGIKSSGYTIATSVPSGAVFTDTKVTITNTNPTSATTYYPIWYTGTSGTGTMNANDGLKYSSLQGTTSAAGEGQLLLGNNTSTGTAGNKRGSLVIYSEKNGYVNLRATAASTTARDIYLPDKAGTVALTSDLSSYLPLTGGTMTGTITTPKDDDKGVIPDTANYGQIGSSSKYFYRGYFNYFYTYTRLSVGKASTNTGAIEFMNSSNTNSGTLLSTAVTAGRTWTLPDKGGTIALTSDLVNTTYTITTGDANGQIKVTPSSGTAYNVGVKGLGTAAYTASTAYASSSHSHNYITFGSNTANRFTANRITYFGWNGRPYIIIDGSSTYYLSGSWS